MDPCSTQYRQPLFRLYGVLIVKHILALELLCASLQAPNGQPSFRYPTTANYLAQLTGHDLHKQVNQVRSSLPVEQLDTSMQHRRLNGQPQWGSDAPTPSLAQADLLTYPSSSLAHFQQLLQAQAGRQNGLTPQQLDVQAQQGIHQTAALQAAQHAAHQAHQAASQQHQWFLPKAAAALAPPADKSNGEQTTREHSRSGALSPTRCFSVTLLCITMPTASADAISRQGFYCCRMAAVVPCSYESAPSLEYPCLLCCCNCLSSAHSYAAAVSRCSSAEHRSTNTFTKHVCQHRKLPLFALQNGILDCALTFCFAQHLIFPWHIVNAAVLVSGMGPPDACQVLALALPTPGPSLSRTRRAVGLLQVPQTGMPSKAMVQTWKTKVKAQAQECPQVNSSSPPQLENRLIMAAP